MELKMGDIPLAECKMEIFVAIVGCSGRMGRRLCNLMCNHPRLKLVGVMDSPQSPLIGVPLNLMEPSISDTNLVILEPVLLNLPTVPDVVIDFSTPDSTVEIAKQAAAAGINLVIGTTGLSPAQIEEIDKASAKVGVIHAMNYSLGVNLLARISREVAEALGTSFDVEIVEAHHNGKVDAPSGTALALAEAVKQGLGYGRLQHGRSGIVGLRDGEEIGIHAMRMGSVVGDHTVYYASEYERIELKHIAQSRDVFAAGALRAAMWIASRPSGRYSMDDVLFGSQR